MYRQFVSRSTLGKIRRANRRKAKAAGSVEYEKWKRFRKAVESDSRISPSKKRNYLFRLALRQGNNKALRYLSKACNIPTESTVTFN